MFGMKQSAAPASDEAAPPPPAEPVIAPRRGAGLVLVRFTRWTAFGETAYQAGQTAGFSRRDADLLVKQGAGREIL